MAPSESFGETILVRALTALVLVWLSFVFGRTLRPGRMPLIERIARLSNPSLSPALCRYTKRLTFVWCSYFIVAALATFAARLPYGTTSAVVWSGTVILFAGERWLRRGLFPGETFPGLAQQLRDTLRIWRTKH